MDYATYQASDAYVEKVAGAGVRIAIYKASDPTVVLIGNTTGINWKDDFEQLAVEEAGHHKVDEIVTGRHSGAATCNGFFTPERNDKLPSVDNFLEAGNGVEYTVMEVVGDQRIGQDTPLNVFEGVKISSHGSGHGARGLKTFDLSFLYTDRHSGAKWAEENG